MSMSPSPHMAGDDRTTRINTSQTAPTMSRPGAALMLLICTMLWGFAFIAQKSAMDSMGALTFAGVRYLLGGLLVLPLALWEKRRQTRVVTLRQWLLILVMSLVFFMGSWLQQTGLATTTATNAGF